MSINHVKNRFIQTIKLYNAIDATFGTLVDLGETYEYHGFLVNTTLDADITLRFQTHEMKIFAGVPQGMDNFSHNGLIEIKYTTAAPTEGYINVISWVG